MSRFRRPFALCCLAFVVVLSAHATVRFARDRALGAGRPLNLRQRAEVIFQNGVRNAQKKNDVFGQVRALQKALSEIRELGPAAEIAGDRSIEKRVRQLKRMIAKENPSETL